MQRERPGRHLFAACQTEDDANLERFSKKFHLLFGIFLRRFSHCFIDAIRVDQIGKRHFGSVLTIMLTPKSIINACVEALIMLQVERLFQSGTVQQNHIPSKLIPIVLGSLPATLQRQYRI